MERDLLVARYGGDLLSGRKPGAGPLFVAATQCIEAGADFDFDAMATEIAPLDALIQRFGRLARAGERDGAPAPAAILAPRADIAARTVDPVYGDRMKAAWDWLAARAEKRKEGRTATTVVDFDLGSIGAAVAADPQAAEAAMTARPPPPYLREADVEFFSETSPRPTPEPALELFLHGEIGKTDDVQIVWRADLAESDFAGETPRAVAIVEAMRPVAAEALPTPVWAARAWLRNDTRTAQHVADATAREESGASGRTPGDRPFVRLRGGEFEIVQDGGQTDALRPGDTVVAPARYGGCDRFGWAPTATTPVEDVADAAWRPYAARRLRIRLHPRLWEQERRAVAAADAAPLPDFETAWGAIDAPARMSSATVARDIAAALAGADLSGSAYFEAVRDLAGRGRSGRPALPYATGADDALAGCVLNAGVDTVSTGADDAASFTTFQLLRDHAAQVEATVRGFADRLRLGGQWPDALGLAGRYHDDGKADERFQAYLRMFADGAAPEGVLAKSGSARAGVVDAWRRAGLPEAGWRHEALSVRLAQARFAQQAGGPQEGDPALALWLVGTHHGYGRPFFRHDDPWDEVPRVVAGATLDAGPGPHRLDFEWACGETALDWPGLFSHLKRRYGVWGLAFLEATLRLADHRASEAAAAAPDPTS